MCALVLFARCATATAASMDRLGWPPRAPTDCRRRRCSSIVHQRHCALIVRRSAPLRRCICIRAARLCLSRARPASTLTQPSARRPD